MIPQRRPYFDLETHTHYLEVPREVYDVMSAGTGMVDIRSFADAVTEGDWIRLECGPERALLRAGKMAVLTRPVNTVLDVFSPMDES